MSLVPVCRALAAAALVLPAAVLSAAAPASAEPAVPVAPPRRPPRRAAELTVQLTSVTPAVVTPDVPLVVEGVVRNDGTTAAPRPTVRAVLGVDGAHPSRGARVGAGDRAGAGGGRRHGPRRRRGAARGHVRLPAEPARGWRHAVCRRTARCR